MFVCAHDPHVESDSHMWSCLTEASLVPAVGHFAHRQVPSRLMQRANLPSVPEGIPVVSVSSGTFGHLCTLRVWLGQPSPAQSVLIGCRISVTLFAISWWQSVLVTGEVLLLPPGMESLSMQTAVLGTVKALLCQGWRWSRRCLPLRSVLVPCPLCLSPYSSQLRGTVQKSPLGSVSMYCSLCCSSFV